MKCPKCNYENDDNNNFCSNCGAKLKDIAILDTAISVNPDVIIEFGKSTSNNYNIAVERAKAYPTYTESITDKAIRHRVTFKMEQIDDIRSMLDLIGRWKSTTIYIDNRAVPYADIAPVLYCYSERNKAFNQKEYCYGRDDSESYNDNDFGCRHCGVNIYSYQGLKGLGGIMPDGTFVVDKNKLIYTVARNLENYLICPALNVNEIKKKLEAFPNRINPKYNKQWEYVTEYDDNKEIAVAVRKKDKMKQTGYVVKDYDKLNDTEFIKLSYSEKSKSKNTIPKSTGCLGCLIPILLFLVIVISILSIWL
jgi:hypothetical protein